MIKRIKTNGRRTKKRKKIMRKEGRDKELGKIK